MESLELLMVLLAYRPLIFFYLLLLGYTAAWLIAFVFSRLLWDREEEIEKVVCKAWGVALTLHLLLTLGLSLWVFEDYFNTGRWIPKGAWQNLLVYPAIFIVDVVLLAFLVKFYREHSRISATG